MDEAQQNQSEVAQKSAGMDEKQEQTWAMLCHLGGLFGFIPPLVIWLIKKEESALIRLTRCVRGLSSLIPTTESQ